LKGIDEWSALLSILNSAGADGLPTLAFFSIVAGLIGEIVGVRSVPIKFEAEGKKRSLEIPSAMDLTIEGITGGDQKSESVITNPPMSVTPGFPMMVAKSVKYTYNDHGMKWDNSGKNSFYSKFAYASQ
jgi:hypothetical protein